MTEQSVQSNTRSSRAGRGLESQTAMLAQAPVTDEPKPASKWIGELVERASTNSQSETHRLYESQREAEGAILRDLEAKRLLSASGLPKRHRDREKVRNGPSDWSAALLRIVNGLGDGFMLGIVGPRGTGKTQLAAIAVKNCCASVRPALYTRAMDVFLAVRETYRREISQSELEVIESFRKPSLLVIDEVQERGETAWEDRILTNLVDKRYGDGTDTLLIANLKPAALAENLGTSIADRLRETGGIIEATWGSFRDSDDVEDERA